MFKDIFNNCSWFLFGFILAAFVATTSMSQELEELKTYARLSPSGEVLEIVQSADVSKQFSPGIARMFEEVAEEIEVGQVKIEGVFVSPKPSPAHVWEAGEWVLPQDVIDRRQKDQSCNEFRNALRGMTLSQNPNSEAQTTAVRNILGMLQNCTL